MMRRVLAATAAVMAMLAAAVFADQRYYVWTYGYQTLARGNAEIESYFTLTAPDHDRLENNVRSEHQLELEIGMTDRFDFAIYQVFRQDAGEALEYQGFKLRSRYRFTEAGRLPLDPLAYLEYIGKPDFAEHEVEFKLVLSKDLGRLNAALNPTLEFVKEGAQEWDLEPAYAMAASWGVNSLLRAGVEGKGSQQGHYIGPTIAHGSEGLWVAIGSAFRISAQDSDAPDLQIRMLLGLAVR